MGTSISLINQTWTGPQMFAMAMLPAFAVVACEIIDHALMNALITALHLAADRVHALWLQVQTCAGLL